MEYEFRIAETNEWNQGLNYWHPTFELAHKGPIIRIDIDKCVQNVQIVVTLSQLEIIKVPITSG